MADVDELAEELRLPEGDAAGAIVLLHGRGTSEQVLLGLGPGRPRPAGILAMSGALPLVPGFVLQLDGLAGLPVAITHGTQDPIIPVELGQGARDRARGAGADVVYRETDVPHIVDPRVVPGLVTWLDARFS